MNGPAGISLRKQVFFHPVKMVIFLLRQIYDKVCIVYLLKDRASSTLDPMYYNNYNYNYIIIVEHRGFNLILTTHSAVIALYGLSF